MQLLPTFRRKTLVTDVATAAYLAARKAKLSAAVAKDLQFNVRQFVQFSLDGETIRAERDGRR